MKDFLNKIICGDCIKVLEKVNEPFPDLIFADPPFNIGYKYDGYNDNLKREKYIDWTRLWMTACKKVLKPAGSFYIAIGDDYAANVKIIADELGLFLRNWIIWHYSFGQQMSNKFARSHTHILYFVNNKSDFTFNNDADLIFSDRQKKYQDKRTSREGKMPDDVWDEYPRVCGTFDERENFPCQMPESLLARVIRVSSNKGDWILDPFSGSGTTSVVAAKLKRNYTGIEISQKYVKESEARIKKCSKFSIEGEGKRIWNERLNQELKWLYHENKVSSEQLQFNPELKVLFTDKFNKRIGTTINPFQPDEVISHLIQLRKSAKLGPLRGEHKLIKTKIENNKEKYLWETGKQKKLKN